MNTMPFKALCLVALLSVPVLAHAADDEVPAEVIAVQIRDQGYQCDHARSAQRDEQQSRPNETVWVLKCDNATYRVTLVPDLAAKVERLD